MKQLSEWSRRLGRLSGILGDLAVWLSFDPRRIIRRAVNKQIVRAVNRHVTRKLVLKKPKRRPP